MKKIILFSFTLLLPLVLFSQEIAEPELIGDVMWINGDEAVLLNQEIGTFTVGMSFAANSLSAYSLEVSGKSSKTRIQDNNISLIIRASDNKTNPLSFIRIIKFKQRSKKRNVVLSEDNSGTMMKSRTHSNCDVIFRGKQYGESSFLLELSNLESGEYCIIVSNPNRVY